MESHPCIKEESKMLSTNAFVQVIDAQSSRIESRNGGEQGSKRISPVIADAIAMRLKKVT